MEIRTTDGMVYRPKDNLALAKFLLFVMPRLKCQVEGLVPRLVITDDVRRLMNCATRLRLKREEFLNSKTFDDEIPF